MARHDMSTIRHVTRHEWAGLDLVFLSNRHGMAQSTEINGPGQHGTRLTPLPEIEAILVLLCTSKIIENHNGQ